MKRVLIKSLANDAKSRLRQSYLTSAAPLIDNLHQSVSSRQLSRNKTDQRFSWVPPAYRVQRVDHDFGYPSRKPTNKPINRPKRGRKDAGSPTSYSQNGKSPRPYLSKEERKMIREIKREKAIILKKEARLLSLYKDVMRLALDYREFFSTDSKQSSLPKALKVEDLGKDKSKTLQTIISHVKDIMKDIHRADTPLEWTQIEETEDHYRALCRILQDITLNAASLSQTNIDAMQSSLSNSNHHQKREADSAQDFVNLAEATLILLVELGQERKLIVEASRRWTSQVRNLSAPAAPPSPEEDTVPRQKSSTLKGWINTILEGFPGSNTTEKPEMELEEDDDDTRSSKMAHEDPDLLATQKVFRSVLTCIAANSKLSSSDPNVNSEIDMNYGSDPEADHDPNDTSPSAPTNREIYEEMAHRMVDLLERMPSDWVPDAASQKIVMETLCNAGTLDSARMCHLIFERHPGNQYRLRFSLVLQAFLEAAKQETDEEILITLIHEALAALNKHWEKNLPSHRVERIMHCSILLNCMSVANMGAVPGMCEIGELIAKRSLSKPIYSRLKEQILSNRPRTDTQTLPLVNYLAQLYASSGEHDKVEVAKQMLKYMMEHDRDGVGRIIIFPDVHTFNMIIYAIVCRYEGKPRDSIDTEVAVADLDYSTDLLQYMLCDSEAACWPNKDTFKLLFRLLSAVDPKDVGERAEELLSRIEIAKCFSGQQSKVDIDLSTYHRVLGCWLQALNASNSNKDSNDHVLCCERSLRLLNKLDIQSTPLLLSDRAMKSFEIPNQYDIFLRPTRRTFKLLLHICLEAATQSNDSAREHIVEIALHIYQRMVDQRQFPSGTDTTQVLQKCCALLPEESPVRNELELLLE